MSDPNLSKANAWRSLEKHLERELTSNNTLKEIADEVSRKLFDDGCYSAAIHRAYLIDRLVEIIEEQRDELAFYEKV